MNFLLINFVIVLLFTCFSCLFVGLFVFFKNRNNFINKIFALYSLSISWWCFWQIGLIASYDKFKALISARIEQIGVFFIPTFFFHFVVSFLNSKGKKWHIRIAYILSFVFAILSLTKYMISDVVPKFYVNYFANPGIAYHFAITFFTIYIIHGLYLLFKEYRISISSKRNKLIYLIWPSILGYIGGGANFLLVYDINIFPLNPFGTYFVGLYVFVFAYAIVRYRLMDIHVVYKKTIIYSLSAGLLTGLFIVLVLTATKFISTFSDVDSFKISVISALIIAFLFNPIKNKIQLIVDKLFYKTTYEFYSTIQKVSHKLATTFDIGDIQRFIVNTIFSTLKLQGIYFLSITGKDYSTIYSRTINKRYPDKGSTIQSLKIDENSELVKHLKKRNNIIIREELPGIVELNKSNIIKKELKPFHGEIVAPIATDGKLESILILCEKSSGDVFTQEDINLVQTITNAASLSIKGAKLYEAKLHSEKLASIGLMATTLAHEIKNPLVSIKTFAQLLPEKYNEGEFRETFSGIVSKEIQRIDGLVTDLLAFSKQSPLKIKKERIEISSLLDDTLKLFSHQYDKNNVEIIKDYTKPLFIEGDRSRLKQAFINLITNSFHAMEQGGVLKLTTVYNNNISILIEDNGIGIPKNEIDHIFNPFFTTKEKGIGLGLAISKNIIEGCGGQIRVVSEPDTSTTFMLTFKPIEE